MSRQKLESPSTVRRFDDNREVFASTERRKFLVKTAALSGAAVAGGAASPAAAQSENLPPRVPKWMQAPGEPVLWRKYGLPSEFEQDVIRRFSPNRPMKIPGEGPSYTPLQSLRGVITPSGLVFERHHGGIPNIDSAQHRLMVHGLVKRPMQFSIDDLMRFPAVSRIYFLECSGNTNTEYRAPTAKSVQFSHGLFSNCEWTGVLLSTVLQEVGLDPKAQWVLAEGADSAAMTRSVPIAKCLDDAMLVFTQNGEALRPEQGYPLRLFLPGWEGNMSIKWLRRIKVASEPFMTREETSKYTDLMPDGRSRQFSYVMEAKSVITFPSPDFKLEERGFYEISGLAWSGNGRISRVHVSTDGGRNWREAQLHEPVLSRAAVRFHLPWRWDGGEAILQSRAVDETGYVQPTRQQIVDARGTGPWFYHNNAIQSWKVSKSGEVTNVHA